MPEEEIHPEAEFEDTIRFGHIAAWSNEFDLSEATLRKKLRGADGIEGKTASGKVILAYAEEDVRKVCKGILNIPQATKEGYFIDDEGVKWAHAYHFQQTLGISRIAILRRLNGCEARSAKDASGRVCKGIFYKEFVVLEKCKDLIESPQTNTDGFIFNGEQKYAAIPVLSRELKVPESMIGKRVKTLTGVSGRNASGMVLVGGFYDLEQVREACKDAIESPQSSEKGFFPLHGERYASVTTWGDEFGISPTTVSKYLAQHKFKGITGKAPDKRVLEEAFFSESQVKAACGELTSQQPQQTDKGFFEVSGVEYRTARGWAAIYGTSHTSIAKKIRQTGEIPIKGKTGHGHITDFYAESSVKGIFGEVDNTILPRADENGFFTEGIDGIPVRWATAVTWSKVYKISYSALKKMLNGKTGRTGRAYSNNQPMKNAFYSETDILEVIKEWQALPIADESSSFNLNGKKYGLKYYWAQICKVSPTTITNRLGDLDGTSISGKLANGKILKNSFYSESVIKSVAGDLFSSSDTNS